MANRQFKLIAASLDFSTLRGVCYAGQNKVLTIGNEKYTSKHTGYVYRSTSNGDQNWSNVHSDWNNQRTLVAITSNGSGVVWCGERTGNSTYNHTIYPSTDYGATWDVNFWLADKGIAVKEGIQTLLCSGSYLWGSGGGATPTHINFMSTNQGSTFSTISQSEVPGIVLQYIHVGSGLLLAVTQDKLYKSTNYGAAGSWSLVYTTPTDYWIRTICAISSTVWLIGTMHTVPNTRYEGKIFRTVNGGSSFDSGTILYGSGAQGVNIEWLFYDPGTTTTYAATSGVYEYQWDGGEWGYILISPARIYKSLDNGASWALIHELQAICYVTGMCLDGNGRLLIAGGGDTITTDGGRLIAKHTQEALKITATEFIASGGKLRSTDRLVHKVSTGPNYLHATGKTLFLSDRGFRYNLGSVSYNVNSSLTDAATYNSMKVLG